MSLVDSIFGSIPGPLIAQFGTNAIYLQHDSTQYYDPAIGTYVTAINYSDGNPSVSTSDIPVKILILSLDSSEIKGEIQSTDVKVLVSAASLGDNIPKMGDMITFDESKFNLGGQLASSQSPRQRTLKIIENLGYRGDAPIFYSLVGRFS